VEIAQQCERHRLFCLSIEIQCLKDTHLSPILVGHRRVDHADERRIVGATPGKHQIPNGLRNKPAILIGQ
jgi:hypothetical protein